MSQVGQVRPRDFEVTESALKKLRKQSEDLCLYKIEQVRITKKQ